MPPWILWKVLWKKYFILQAATTPSKEGKTFYCIHFVWSCKQVFLPNFLWFHFWKWIRLDSTRVLQLRQQKPIQRTASFQGLSSEPGLFQVEQVSPVTADNEFNAEPFYALPSNLQIQHWWTANKGLLKRLRGKTTDFNILLLKKDLCEKMEYINIRGYDCYNCTAKMTQKISWHIHCDSYHYSCQFTSASNGAIKSPGGEDNFGFYETINSIHRCTSENDSTTQWWFGEQ